MARHAKPYCILATARGDTVSQFLTLSVAAERFGALWRLREVVMRTVTILATLSDNYSYVVECDGQAVVIDAGEASPVLRYLGASGARLVAALGTHGHFDHTGGNRELVERTGCNVLLPETLAAAGDTLSVGPFQFVVLRTPGHSPDSVCFHLPAGDGSPGDVFTGDTLFIGGCGRLLTRSPEVMWVSLTLLAGLPGGTRVYPGHDYTLENLEFALTVEPQNSVVKRRLEEVRSLVQAGRQPVPSTIALERATNPFLRAGDPAMKAALGLMRASDVDSFAELRRRKDRF